MQNYKRDMVVVLIVELLRSFKNIMDKVSSYKNCPKCLLLAQTEIENVMDSYGKIPSNEFLSNISKAKKNLLFIHNSTSFYETAYIHFNNDKFSIVYDGNCSKCGFDYKFKHSEFTKDIIIMKKLEN